MSAALKLIECPKCKGVVGRIIVGAGEWACRHDRLRLYVESGGEDVRIVRVDKLPPRRPQSEQ